MRRIILKTRPENYIEVPKSDGYSIYAAILSVLNKHNPNLSDQIHDTDKSIFHASGVIGETDDSDKKYKKILNPNNTYTIVVGITNELADEVFDVFSDAFILGDDTLELAEADLLVNGFDSESTTHENIHKQAQSLGSPDFEVKYKRPTCILESSDITTLFPHRRPVFTSLLSKWNQTAPEHLQLDLTEDDITQNVVEAGWENLASHNVVANRVPHKGGKKNIYRHGFTGTVRYGFRNSNKRVTTAILTLALFSEYSGIGCSVARGCGNVSLSICE